MKQIITDSGLTPRCDVSDPETLRKMKPSDCYIVTQKRLMRGFDYRGTPIDNATATLPCEDSTSRTKLSLLLACSADTERDYIQALGRVGRYGDACARYRLHGVAKVDEDKQDQRDAVLMNTLVQDDAQVRSVADEEVASLPNNDKRISA